MRPWRRLLPVLPPVSPRSCRRLQLTPDAALASPHRRCTQANCKHCEGASPGTCTQCYVPYYNKQGSCLLYDGKPISDTDIPVVG